MKIHQLFENDHSHLTMDNISQIYGDCKPYLDYIGNQVDDLVMYRGVTSQDLFDAGKTQSNVNFPRYCKIIDVRKDRKPMSTNKTIHKIADDWFEEKFGIRHRSMSLFTVGNWKSATEYGTPFIVLPRGEFRFVWAKFIDDFFSSLNVPNRKEYSTPTEYDELYKYVRDLLDSGGYQDHDLIAALTEFNDHEIMVHCESYYAIDKRFYFSEFVPAFNNFLRTKND